MNKKSILLYLMIAILAVACNHVYKKYDKDSFPTYAWKYGQEIVFNPTIDDISKSYKLILGMRHLYGLQLGSLPVTVTSIAPSGKETTRNYELKIKDAADKYIGNCAGDLCDLETVVDENLKFEEPGQYKYIIKHNVQAEKIPGVMEFGLILDAVE